MPVVENFSIFSCRVVSDKVVRDILSFRDLPQCWHYGEGVPAEQIIVVKALKMREILLKEGAEKFEAFPCVDGSIVISAFAQNYQVDVTVSANAYYDVYIEENDTQILDCERVEITKIVDVVRELKWTDHSPSGYFTQNISPIKEVVSTAPPYRRQMMELPLSTKSVPSGARSQSVNMWSHSTHRTSRGIHQFSSESTQENQTKLTLPKTQQKQVMCATF